MDDKKKWEKPELEMLAQGTPEEAVLGTCKTGTIQGPDDAGSGRPSTCYNLTNTEPCNVQKAS